MDQQPEDSLTEVPTQMWGDVRDMFRNMGTNGVPFYCTLNTFIKYPRFRETFQFKLLSPFGDVTKGLFAKSVKGTIDEYCIMAVSEDTEELEDAIARTNMIDWNKDFFIELVNEQTRHIVERLQSRLSWSYCNIEASITFIYEKTRNLLPQMRLPANVYEGKVKQEHIPRVNNAWPYKYEGSDMYFGILVANDLSYGLYSTQDHSLVAWVFINEYGFICHLYCEEPYRRSGCAEYLITQLVNGQLNRGEDAYGFVVKDNEKPARLFSKLGFKLIGDFFWCHIRQ